MPAPKFPKKLYVKIENPGCDDQYFAAVNDHTDLSEQGLVVRAGVYELVETVNIVSDVKIKVRTKA